jgi:endo-1,3-1,4-beta-glycanase ExoK
MSDGRRHGVEKRAPVPLIAALLALGVGCAADPRVQGGDAGTAAPEVPGRTDALIPGTFELAWQDDFDAFDATRWQLMTHTWDGNLAQFSTENTTFEGGIASLLLTSMPLDTAKPFRGVEMRSRDTLTYGKVETRARFAHGSGVVSAMVLIYTPYPADDWNELDIEYLGGSPQKVQFNAMVYNGAPVAKPATQSVSPTQYPMVVPLGEDAGLDFHVYGIEWTPNDARFTVDGEVKYVWATKIDRLKLPQNILLTIWASSAAGWAGPINADSAPSTAEYDWIHVYTWKPTL